MCVCVCLYLCTALCVWERESERQHCCICSSLKGANERTCVPPGLVEWGVDEGLAFPSSPIVKTVSRQKGELDPQTLIWQQFGGSSPNDEGDARRRPCWARLSHYLKKSKLPITEEDLRRAGEMTTGITLAVSIRFLLVYMSFWTYIQYIQVYSVLGDNCLPIAVSSHVDSFGFICPGPN